MDFVPTELIRKKRGGGEHSRDELKFLVSGFTSGRIPDYQISAWMMAVCFRGMTEAETAWLTTEMRDSGRVLDLASLGVTVDKHSTGGIGDKTSLILAPLVAAAGVPVPMMAGRGLGFTGGTLDKLESIAGFDVNLSLDRFAKQVGEIGAAIIGQTPEICPADRKLYALRDVTGTVDSLPLICGSIMSKKLAEGMSCLVLDVKYGSGAFMKSLDDAERLARALKDIGERAGKRVIAVLTSMQQPLGRYVGNALEIKECLDIMAGRPAPTPGKGYEDTIALTVDLAGHMIFLGGRAKNAAEGRLTAQRHLADGSAAKKFDEICRAQGADPSRPLTFTDRTEDVVAERDGFVDFTDCEAFGQAAILLGAGRTVQGQSLDFATGLEVLVAQGAPVVTGEPLLRIHHSGTKDVGAVRARLRDGYRITTAAVPTQPLVAKIIT